MTFKVTDPYTKPRSVHERKWGGYQVLHDVAGLKVKTLTIDPGEIIPMQYHENHDEVWWVIEGEGKAVFIDGDVTSEFPLIPNMVFDIAANRPHEIRNTGVDPLIFLEIQQALIMPGGDAVMV